MIRSIVSTEALRGLPHGLILPECCTFPRVGTPVTRHITRSPPILPLRSTFYLIGFGLVRKDDSQFLAYRLDLLIAEVLTRRARACLCRALSLVLPLRCFTDILSVCESRQPESQHGKSYYSYHRSFSTQSHNSRCRTA